MKSLLKFRIVPRWEPGKRIAIPLHYRAPIARRAPAFFPENFLFPEEEAWRTSAPLT